MGENVTITKDGTLVKLYWTSNVEKNEKRVIREKIIQEYTGKLCVAYQRTKDGYTATNIVTKLPNEVNFDVILNKILETYNNDDYTIDRKENSINISLIINDGKVEDSPKLKLSIYIYISKKKILVQSNAEDLEKFANTYLNIINSLNEVNEEGVITNNYFKNIFKIETPIAEVSLKPDFQLTSLIDQIATSMETEIETEIPIVLEENKKTEQQCQPAATNNESQSTMEQNTVQLFLELKEDMKDIQRKFDEVLHAIKSIDQIEMNVKKCQTECLLINDNIKNLQCQINEIKKDQESLHANLSSSTSKINNLITRQSRIESEALVNIPETIQDQCNAMKQSIYDDLSKRFNSEIEQSLSFSINSLKQPSTTFHIPKSPSKSNTQVMQPSTQEIQLTQKLPRSYSTVISTTPTHPPKQPNQTHNSNQNPEPPRPKTIESKDTKLPHDGKQSKTFEQENVLIGDSNIKFISSTRFPEKIAKIRCGTYQSLPETIKNIDLQNAKHIILHLGTNDIETAKSPQEFEENVLNALDAISNKYPESEITISELFPRKDTQQKKVQTANDILNKIAETIPWKGLVGLLRHPYIEQDMLEDSKHLNRYGLKPFITNIKNALFGYRHLKEYSIW